MTSARQYFKIFVLSHPLKHQTNALHNHTKNRATNEDMMMTQAKKNSITINMYLLFNFQRNNDESTHSHSSVIVFIQIKQG